MAARVLLLMTCTALFAAAWESDRPQSGGRSVALSVRRQRELNVTSPEADFSHCVIPSDLAPGQYRVIDASGHVGWLNVPADDRHGSARLWPEVTTSQSARGRWYFIRIVETRVIATTPAEMPSRR